MFPLRRDFLRLTTLAGGAWLTPLGQMLARAAEAKPSAPAKSVIVLWMQGGPSQLETFDPHPGSNIAAGTQAIETSVKGIQLVKGYERLAEEMQDVALIRSMTSKEGDHERGTYTVKTGYRPDPTVVHPSLGSIVCHELATGSTDIPRHVSILSSQWPARGGFLGDKWDAFRTDDPDGAVPDTKNNLPASRDEQRMNHLGVIEAEFAKGRGQRAENTLHKHTLGEARKLMTSEQLKAFDVSLEPAATRKQYGDTPFGRGCLAARRLIEVGVRCVEVNLGGWDTHINNHSLCAKQAAILDPAFAALLKDLRERKLLGSTIVLCAGEFGRTPKVNPAGGRDHWPHAFSVALAGGGLKGGQVIGETDPEGGKDATDPVTLGDLHATILKQLGIDFARQQQTPIGRTYKFADGEPVGKLIQ
jgi:hypothetical protein